MYYGTIWLGNSVILCYMSSGLTENETGQGVACKLQTDLLPLQRQALKVTRVVKDLLGLAADGQHCLDCDGRVLATQRLRPQQHTIRSIQYSICHIRCFCPTPSQKAVSQKQYTAVAGVELQRKQPQKPPLSDGSAPCAQCGLGLQG